MHYHTKKQTQKKIEPLQIYYCRYMEFGRSEECSGDHREYLRYIQEWVSWNESRNIEELSISESIYNLNM